MFRPDPRWVLFGGLILAGAVATIRLLEFPRFLVDDAYITLRYARNLADHGQLTWNAGLDPVEGYTGIALPVLLAVLHRPGFPLETGTHLVGVGAYVLIPLVVFATLARLQVRPAIRFVVLSVYLLAPSFVVHAWAGLETLSFVTTCLLALYAYVVWHEHPDCRRATLLLSGALLLPGLVRPEGLLIALLLLTAALFGAPLRDPTATKTLLRRSLAFTVPVVVYIVWRWSYYGRPLPNTFYAKVATSSGIDADSWASLKWFFTAYLRTPMLVVGLVTALATVLAPRSERRALLRHMWFAGLTPLLAFLAATVVVYLRSALVMNYSFRFFVHLYPFVLLVLAVAAERSLRSLHQHSRRLTIPISIALCVVALLQSLDQSRLHPAERDGSRAYMQLLTDEHIAIGRHLRRYVPSDEWLAVYEDAGAIPFYSGLKTIDLGGLNDEFLARSSRSAADLADYLYSAAPGVIVVTKVEGPGLRRRYREDTRAILSDPRLARYRLVDRVSTRAPGWEHYDELLYVRSDIAVPPVRP